MTKNLILVLICVSFQTGLAFALPPATLAVGAQLSLAQGFTPPAISTVFVKGDFRRYTGADLLSIPANEAYCTLFIRPYMSHGRRGWVIRSMGPLVAGTAFSVAEPAIFIQKSYSTYDRMAVEYVLSADRDLDGGDYISLTCEGPRGQALAPSIVQIQAVLGELFEIR